MHVRAEARYPYLKPRESPIREILEEIICVVVGISLGLLGVTRKQPQPHASEPVIFQNREPIVCNRPYKRPLAAQKMRGANSAPRPKNLLRERDQPSNSGNGWSRVSSLDQLETAAGMRTLGHIRQNGK